jgi:hypothetical protein
VKRYINDYNAKADPTNSRPALRNAEEVVDYLREHHSTPRTGKRGAAEKAPLVGLYYGCIGKEDLNHDDLSSARSLRGTMKLHSMMYSARANQLGGKVPLQVRLLTCCCDHCLGGDFEQCINRDYVEAPCPRELSMKDVDESYLGAEYVANTFIAMAERADPSHPVNARVLVQGQEDDELDYWMMEVTEGAHTLPAGENAAAARAGCAPGHFVLQGHYYERYTGHSASHPNPRADQAWLQRGDRLYYLDRGKESVTYVHAHHVRRVGFALEEVEAADALHKVGSSGVCQRKSKPLPPAGCKAWRVPDDLHEEFLSRMDNAAPHAPSAGASGGRGDDDSGPDDGSDLDF